MGQEKILIALARSCAIQTVVLGPQHVEDVDTAVTQLMRLLLPPEQLCL